MIERTRFPPSANLFRPLSPLHGERDSPFSFLCRMGSAGLCGAGGVEQSRYKVGMKAQDTCELFIDNVKLGPEHLLGGK